MCAQSDEVDGERVTPAKVLVDVNNLDVYYGSAQALKDVSLSIGEGSVTAIIGPNGSGKSTLLDCITGFKDFEGEITYRGESISNNSPWELGGKIGYCTEEGNLFTDMTVRQNLQLGGYTVDEDKARLERRVYDLFPRLEERTAQPARTLSGGEQKMLSIGRSLMTDPDLLILDEPSLGLAPTVIKDISEALEDIHDRGMTILLAEQNVSLALDHADVVYLLEHGTVEMAGTPAELQGEQRIRESYFG